MKKVILFLTVIFLLISCATQHKLGRLETESVRANIHLPESRSYVPEIQDIPVVHRDTLKVKDLEGKEVFIMRAVKDDETGEMVATEEIQAAVITARFRNVAERHGKIDLEFQVTVPSLMQDSKWQLRFHPDMFVMEDSLRLEDVVITGMEYRKAQLRGYQLYERFVNRIVTDSTRFIDMRNLEIFLQRNIPAIYAFRADTTEVSEETFLSCFGVSERQAIDHYTDKLARNRNDRRRSNREKMWRRYVRTPIVTEGIRLDTVIVSDEGDFIYNYVQTVSTRSGLRKIDVVLSGDIYEQDRKVYTMPRSEPLTFYVSSVATLTDNTERFMTKILSRRLSANTSANIEFRSGRWEIEENLQNNPEEIGFIKTNLRSLLENDEFELDSITIVSFASPEGSEKANLQLCLRRARSTSEYFDRYVQYVRDSIRREEGVFIDVGENMKESLRSGSERTNRKIVFLSRPGGENWNELESLVQRDSILSERQKDRFTTLVTGIQDKDSREKHLMAEDSYPHIREKLYPRLRSVRFDFALHRKGMVKDTVHTTELDTIYMKGVQAIRDREYEKAIEILRPYQDYNTAIAYVAMDYNSSAMAILEKCEATAPVNYMLAVLYARRGDDENAVQHYLNSCAQEASYIYRGNLDPEISYIIKKYNLNKQESSEL